jgi:archaeal flagellar protein FlaJ
MTLTRTQRSAYRLLGPTVERSARSNAHLRLTLQRAHITLRPEVYLAYAYYNMLAAFAASAAVVLVLYVFVAFGALALPTPFLLGAGLVPFVLPVMIYLVAHALPDVRAASRARDIDAKLPYALNYIASLASVGVTPDRIFASLARQPLYGEVAAEAAWISRDLRLLGHDLMTALTRAIDRSPSLKFQDFLQGAITALASGENLKLYFLSKSHQFVQDNRQAQRRFLDNLGVLAESYVTVVVAAPLLLLVLLSVMVLFGGGGSNMLRTGYVLILVLLPLAMAGFALAIKYVTPEV